MIFRNLDFWIGICCSGALVPLFLDRYFFSKARDIAEQLSRGPFANPEYDEFWRQNGPRPASTETIDQTGMGHTTTVHTPARPAKQVPDEEMSAQVKNGKREVQQRIKELQYIEIWKSRNSTVGMVFGFSLFCIILVRLLQ